MPTKINPQFLKDLRSGNLPDLPKGKKIKTIKKSNSQYDPELGIWFNKSHKSHISSKTRPVRRPHRKSRRAKPQRSRRS